MVIIGVKENCTLLVQNHLNSWNEFQNFEFFPVVLNLDGE